MDDGLSLVIGSLMGDYVLTALLLMCVLPLLLATLSLVALVAITVSFHSWWLPLATSAVLGAFALIHRLPAQSRLRHASTAAIANVG
ncbi:hypothetical protein BH23ACT10_BH23ACT10_12100 [soil metagenome]